MKNVNNVSMKHGNIIGSQIYDFEEILDYAPPLMHVKDGAAMRVITLQRTMCQNLNEEEKNSQK